MTKILCFLNFTVLVKFRMKLNDSKAKFEFISVVCKIRGWSNRNVWGKLLNDAFGFCSDMKYEPSNCWGPCC